MITLIIGKKLNEWMYFDENLKSEYVMSIPKMIHTVTSANVAYIDNAKIELSSLSDFMNTDDLKNINYLKSKMLLKFYPTLTLGSYISFNYSPRIPSTIQVYRIEFSNFISYHSRKYNYGRESFFKTTMIHLKEKYNKEI